jgi:hypothetical protein
MDQECEAVVSSFLRARYGDVKYPISTNDLVILLEQETSSVDLYADLSFEGSDVEGLTLFLPGRKPNVQIAKQLTEDQRRENRLRTTLTHELGHVRFQNFLWAFDERQARIEVGAQSSNQPKCKRDTMLEAPLTDWMEWQAGYACGAFLMPSTALKRLVTDFRHTSGVMGTLTPQDSLGQDLVKVVQAAFQVSMDAARVRLLRLKFMTDNPSMQTFLDV